VAVAFHSLSRPCTMTGWRVGFVVGDREIVAGIGNVKSNIDSGNFGAVQDAGIVALKNAQKIASEMRKTYQERMELLYAGLKKIGLEVEKPEATFYLWAWTGGRSKDYTRKLIDNLGIVATPGVGFGDYGEGYVRFSVTQPTERIAEAVERMERMVAEEKNL